MEDEEHMDGRGELLRMLAVIVVIVLVVVGGLLVYWFAGPSVAKLDARVRGDIGQEYIIQDARTRVGTYEWFYDQYEEIQATELKVRIAKGAEEESGIRMVLASMIAEYNAMARKEHTRAQWMPTDLPYQIEMEVEI